MEIWWWNLFQRWTITMEDTNGLPWNGLLFIDDDGVVNSEMLTHSMCNMSVTIFNFIIESTIVKHL